MEGDPPVGGGAAGEALALAPHRHDQLLHADGVHAVRQVLVPASPSLMSTAVHRQGWLDAPVAWDELAAALDGRMHARGGWVWEDGVCAAAGYMAAARYDKQDQFQDLS